MIKQLRCTMPALVILFLLFLAACAPDFGRPHPEKSTSEKLFQMAESHFSDGEYDFALRAYSEYMSHYPDEPDAPAALYKMGSIYSWKGKNDRARNCYQQILNAYPESPFCRDAMVETLEAYYRDKRYSDVVRSGLTVPDTLSPDDYLKRKYMVMGDAYFALGKFMKASVCYASVYARVEKDYSKAAVGKFIKSLAGMKPEELDRLFEKLEEPDLKGYVAFRKCRNFVESGARVKGVEALDRFIAEYPGHPLIREARTLKEKTEKIPFFAGKIGCLMPMTGKYGGLGVQARNGFDLAVKRFISGSNPVTISVVYKDTESNPEKTVAAVRELAELGVSAIVGPVGTVEEAAKEAQDRGIPIITLTGRDDIRRTGDCVFRNFLTGKMQVDTLANYAMDRLGLRRFAIFYPDEAYGKDMVRLFRDRVGAKGGNIVGAISYSPKTQDYKSQIRKLTGQSGPTREDGDDDGESGYIEDDDLPVHGGKAPRPVIDFDAVFIPDEGEKIAMILPQMARCGIRNVCFLGTNLWHTPRLIEKSGRFLQKTILTEGFFPQSKDPVVQDFVSAYKTAYSGTPGFLEAVTYDSAMIVMDAIRRGASSHKNLRDNLLAMKKFKGVTGITSFDVSGDAIKTVYLLKADDKGFGEIRH